MMRRYKKKVLVACEESQTVCKAFRKLGHEEYSCDLQEPSGGHPEWHILGDALRVLDGGEIITMDGKSHNVGRWDLKKFISRLEREMKGERFEREDR